HFHCQLLIVFHFQLSCRAAAQITYNLLAATGIYDFTNTCRRLIIYFYNPKFGSDIQTTVLKLMQYTMVFGCKMCKVLNPLEIDCKFSCFLISLILCQRDSSPFPLHLQTTGPFTTSGSYRDSMCSCLQIYQNLK